MGAVRGLPARIITHNVRHYTPEPFKGELPWSSRARLVVNQLLYNTRNQDCLVGLQEVLHHQLVDILSGLNKDVSTEDRHWEYIGVGRDDGRQDGEYSPIFYQPSIWQLRHWETVWISETPDVPSKDWDSSCSRIATIGVFTHHASQKTVLAVNTHLDDQGTRARLEGARIILNKISEYQTNEYRDVISGFFVVGDFNSEESQEAYSELTASHSPLLDTYKLLDPAERYGNYNTYTSFGYENEPESRIDYIFLGPASGEEKKIPWKVKGYAVLANRFDDGILNSDHRAVVADAVLD